MPALDQAVINGMERLLREFLKGLDGYGEPEYLDSGGSAAVYKVPMGESFRVFKVFNPKFFEGPGGEAERRRLEVQKRLTGDLHPSLVKTFQVAEAEGTAFLEMEYIDWPQLKNVLSEIPDKAVIPLITQLVSVVRYLEEKDIIHRDIKPENIHVSTDYTKLVLLDLGVAREFEISGQDEAAISDHGNSRPFLATAQYSSPEYLFRLDEPTAKLWRGLNFYQVGAVLHDLINKKPLFQDEMDLGNRWLVAKAVLTKVPSFSKLPNDRLPHLRALASRCLVKNLDSRLKLVGWNDFRFDEADDPLVSLQGKLARMTQASTGIGGPSLSAHLKFDRAKCLEGYIESVRTKLIAYCGTTLPFDVIRSTPRESEKISFLFEYEMENTISCNVSVDWQGEPHANSAKIKLEAHLVNDHEDKSCGENYKDICILTIQEGHAESVTSLCGAIANVVSRSIDLLEANEDTSKLHCFDLQNRNTTEVPQ